MASARSRLYGQPSTRVPLVISSCIAVLAVLGQTIALTSDDQDTFGLGMFVILGINAVIGLVAVFRMDPYSNPMSRDPRVSAAMGSAAWAAFGIILVAVGIQIVLGLPQAIIIAAGEQWDDWTVVFAPFLFAGLVGTGGALAGFLVGMLVIWPIIKLIDALVRKATGREQTPGAAPLSVVLMATVAAAIFTVLAPHAETSGTPRGRGLALVVGVWFDYSGNPQDQAFAWTARSLQLVIAGALVWLVFDVRARKKVAGE